MVQYLFIVPQLTTNKIQLSHETRNKLLLSTPEGRSSGGKACTGEITSQLNLKIISISVSQFFQLQFSFMQYQDHRQLCGSFVPRWLKGSLLILTGQHLPKTKPINYFGIISCQLTVTVFIRTASCIYWRCRKTEWNLSGKIFCSGAFLFHPELFRQHVFVGK